MRRRSAAAIATALLATTLAATPTAAADQQAALDRLQQGGAVILMRHAQSSSGQAASVGMAEGCQLQPGRGLDAQGFYQARAIGEFFKLEGVSIIAGHTSELCRAWDTARLVAGGSAVAPSPALKTTDPEQIGAFKSVVAQEIAAAQDGNVLLVTHSNIVPLFSNWSDETAEIPSGLVLVIDPFDWKIKGCLDFTAAANKPSSEAVCLLEKTR